MHRVRGQPAFWNEVDALRAIGDPRADEVESLWRALVEYGPDLPGARPTRIPLWNLWLDGYDMVFDDGSGFVQYGVVPEMAGAQQGIVLYRAVYFL